MLSGPLYEKSALVAAGLDADFASWLDGHVADARTFAGVVSVDLAEAVTPEEDRHRYTWRYSFANDEALDVFLERRRMNPFPGPDRPSAKMSRSATACCVKIGLTRPRANRCLHA